MADMKTDALDKISEMLALQRENWPGMAAEHAGVNIAVQRLSRLLERAAHVGLGPFKLSLTEFELLCALRSQPPPHRLTPSSLYDAMLISSGGLTKVLGKLEERDLITRPVSTGDRRSRPVALTALGADLVERAMAAVQRVERPMMTAMADALGEGASPTDVLVSLALSAEVAGLDETD
ncbi:MarR family winged helix-turn-helix transcriptional regulator [Chachezhania antarctica]|uniref:MarR family winged helix-turn-helix transcriptional regulator n=1 Tax=Chachezhania antarctica TaxID=2340860 RepID=UPI000EB2F960|nr:MarR family transcriptional regulator [Chachezhania antarctica]|tara:strand:+ start:246 stop:782 length:537 start_codon:yes stop_codon:yes gene_type:complete